MERENAFYKDYLGLKEEHPDFTFQDAMVIGRDGNDPFGSFTIDNTILRACSSLPSFLPALSLASPHLSIPDFIMTSPSSVIIFDFNSFSAFDPVVLSIAS